jgi:hypothetical protein
LVIPALWRPKLEDHDFEATLGYLVRPTSKKVIRGDNCKSRVLDSKTGLKWQQGCGMVSPLEKERRKNVCKQM